MFQKSLITFAVATLASAACLAQTSEPAPTNTHRAYDLKLRDCRKQAIDQQLQGEELRAFVASCMKR